MGRAEKLQTVATVGTCLRSRHRGSWGWLGAAPSPQGSAQMGTCTPLSSSGHSAVMKLTASDLHPPGGLRLVLAARQAWSGARPAVGGGAQILGWGRWDNPVGCRQGPVSPPVYLPTHSSSSLPYPP